MRELDPTQTQRAGRPAVPLAPARGTVAGVGMEVNVDYLGVRAIDLAGRRAGRARRARRPARRRPAAVLDRLAALVGTRDRRAARRRRRASPAPRWRCPGWSTASPARCASRRNLGWRDVDVVGALSAHPEPAFPPRVANEANLAARAEAHARRGVAQLRVRLRRGRHRWRDRARRRDLPRPARLERRDRAHRRRRLPRPARVRREPRGARRPGRHAARRGPAADRPARRPARRARRRRPARDRRRRAGRAGRSASRWRAWPTWSTSARWCSAARSASCSTTCTTRSPPGSTSCVIFAPWSPLDASRPARAGQYPAMTGGALAALATVLADPAEWLRTHETP